MEASRFDSERDRQPKPFVGSLAQLVGNSHTIREQKVGAPAFSLVRYRPGELRGNDGVSEHTAVGLDYDHLGHAQLELLLERAREHACVAYTTFSDHATGPEDRSVRLIFPIKRPLSKADYRLVRDEIVAEIGLPADGKASDPARIWFTPSCPEHRASTAFIIYTDGVILDPDEYLRIAVQRAAECTPDVVTSPVMDASTSLEVETPIPLETVRARAARLRDPQIRALVAASVAGEVIAHTGSRNSDVWRLLCALAFVAPDTDAPTLVEFVRPSLDRMAELEPAGHVSPAAAHEMATRALADARRKRGKTLERGDEVEIANELVDALMSDTELVFAEGEFHRYNRANGLWEVLQREVLSREVQRFAGRLVVAGDKPRPLKVSRRMVEGAVALGADQVSKPDFFDEGPAGVAFRNGFVTVTGSGVQQAPHAPANRARSALRFDYDPAARCDRFRQYLDEVFVGDADADEKKDALQEFAGACVLGIAVRYARALILLGSGRNGKSVLLDVLLELFEDDARAAVPPQQFENDYHRALLAGKRINVVAELPRADIMRGEAFKAIVAGDAVSARQIYCPPIRFRPCAGHIMAANGLPGSDDLTPAFWERVLIVQFNRMFAQAERDKTLMSRGAVRDPPGAPKLIHPGAGMVIHP